MTVTMTTAAFRVYDPVPKLRPKIAVRYRTMGPRSTGRKRHLGLVNDLRVTAFEQEVALRCRHTKLWFEGRVALTLDFRLPSATRGDLSNFVKSVEDGLVGEAFKDDAQVYSINAIRTPIPNEERPYVEIIIADYFSQEKKEGGPERKIGPP